MRPSFKVRSWTRLPQNVRAYLEKEPCQGTCGVGAPRETWRRAAIRLSNFLRSCVFGELWDYAPKIQTLSPARKFCMRNLYPPITCSLRYLTAAKSLLRFGQRTVGTTYHAMASSAIFASQVKAGLTIPGLKKVPTPGCRADQRFMQREMETEANGARLARKRT